jgi:oligopeptide transport system substrate-binding protein
MRLTATLLLTIAALVGCADDPGDRFGRFRPRDEQVLYFNNFEEPEYLDPGLLTGHPDSFVASQLFEGLTEPDPKTLKTVPGVASRWSTDDGRVWTFHLRDDARWSDGTPVTAHDFVYAWERVLRPSTAARYAYQLYPLKHARRYNAGEVKRIADDRARPRRAPFVLEGDVGAVAPPVLESFPPNARVLLEDSNLRRAREGSVVLRDEPEPDAARVAELGDAPGLVVAVRPPPGVGFAAGKRDPDTWVQLRPPGGGVAGWCREAEVTVAYPNLNLRRVDALADRFPLRSGPSEDSPVRAWVEDDAEVELLELRAKGDAKNASAWGRAYDPLSGAIGWAPLDHLDDVTGDRHWFYVEVDDFRPSVFPEDARFARRGWLPARHLFADGSVLGFRATGDHTLVVELERPTPYFLSLTHFSALRPVPRAAVEAHGARWTRPEHIVTSGPFHLVMHRPRDRMELVRSKTYWDKDAVQLDRAVIYAVSDVHTNVNLFRAGYLDAMHSAKLPVELVPGLRDKRDYVAGPYLATYFVRLNTTVKPLDDVRVRQALNLAVDKSLLTGKLLGGGQVTATHIVPPGLPGYPVVEGAAFDVAKAKQLLAEAGFPGGQGFPKLEFLYNTSEEHRVVAEYLQRQWRDNLGVDIRLANQEWKTFLKKLHTMDYQLTRSGWIGDYLDPNTFLEMWVTGGGNNETGYANPAYDALIARAAETRDPAARAAVFVEAEQMLNRDVPFVPLYYYVNNFLLAPEVNGIHTNLLDEHPLKHVTVSAD